MVEFFIPFFATVSIGTLVALIVQESL